MNVKSIKSKLSTFVLVGALLLSVSAPIVASASPLATAYTGPAYPYVYTTTYSNASQTNVRMVMFNPEWTTSVFPRVSGSWNHQVW